MLSTPRLQDAAATVTSAARGSTSDKARSSSPSDQAWNGQPRGACGGSASAISATWPSPRLVQAREQRARGSGARPRACASARVAAHAQPGLDERARSARARPCPGGRPVALDDAAARSAAGSRARRRQRAQAERRQQLALDRVDDARSRCGSTRSWKGRPPTARIWFGPERRVVACPARGRRRPRRRGSRAPRSRTGPGRRPAPGDRGRRQLGAPCRARSRARSATAPGPRPACRSAA